jgi:hypothetical protein
MLLRASPFMCSRKKRGIREDTVSLFDHTLQHPDGCTILEPVGLRALLAISNPP